MSLARLRSVGAVLLLLLAIAVAVETRSAAPARAAATFTNPVAAAPYGADPWMGYYNGYYYLAATTWNNQIVIKRATSVAALPGATENVVFTGTATNSCCNVWAPSMHRLNGPNGYRWYFYYSAGTAACCDGQRSFVLESSGDNPLGPYTFKGQLNVQANNGWAIDGSVATINGANYFLYSSWVGDLQSLFIAPMSNPWTVSALGTRISYPTYDWEKVGGNTEEGPYVLQRNGKTFLTFSASSCNTPDYKIGQLTLTGSNPLSASSWTKKSTPIFQRSDGNSVYGPGHHSFFTSPDGTETWMAYHANETTAQGCGGTRTTRIKKVNFNSDDSPNLGTPDKLSTTLTAPSGDPGGTVSFPVAGVSYRLTNQASGKVLDAVNCGTANGTAIDQWQSLGNACQQWKFTKTTSNYYRITNANSGTVLDSVNCGTANGTALNLWASLGNACQEWSLTPINGGYLIANRGNGLVLDVTNCGTANGVAVRQWASLGNACQQWNIAV
ncbi:hydrolase [Actinoplanes italicus]|uniref:GH43 family beta-xylosidase n=1 Tax=Actinoplanes italicus TaxID=113567 RepID=A0A2T0JYJ3_9ACTN|nr:family 43 glycosylhydrolase [Actinoplanes italicus]PRX13935.1 GH43 family beta-xylosidase [Actinoplanes italicus]GIE35656.1 hydrolase [Actinoplanes italicus]